MKKAIKHHFTALLTAATFLTGVAETELSLKFTVVNSTEKEITFTAEADLLTTTLKDEETVEAGSTAAFTYITRPRFNDRLSSFRNDSVECQAKNFSLPFKLETNHTHIFHVEGSEDTCTVSLLN